MGTLNWFGITREYAYQQLRILGKQAPSEKPIRHNENLN